MRTLFTLLLAFAAAPIHAADRDAPRTPGAEAMHTGAVVDIDANTRIRFDPRLRNVTGTDTAAAGASASMEERHRQELKSGAAGPDEDTVRRALPPAAPSGQERRTDKLEP